LKGRKLATRKTSRVRPTAEKVRQSLFNVLGDWIEDKEVLDLFAGFGTLGLEALSRGAAEAVFVENHLPAARLIVANLRDLGIGNRGRVITLTWETALRILGRSGRVFDLILADPPYSYLEPEESVRPDFGQKLLFLADRYSILSQEGIVVIEHFSGRHLVPCPGWRMSRRIKHGQTALTVFIRGNE